MAKRGLKRTFVFRAKLVLFVILMLTLVPATFKLYDLQINNYEIYLSKAQGQYSYKSRYYDRGAIYFNKYDGELFSAATVKTAYILAVNPMRFDVGQADKVYEFLTKTLGLQIKRSEFNRKISKKNDPYEELLKGLDKQTIQKLRTQKFKGIQTPIYRYRYYPGSSLASHVLGFVAQKADDPELHGRYGLEKYYDAELFRDKEKLSTNFFAELLSGAKNVFVSDKKHGSLVSTIEPIVQTELEKVLQKTARKWHSKRVSAIVYNPHNGEVIAMASYPNFDLNNFSKVPSVSIYENPLVENVYEMGSIVKAITVAAGLESGVISENSTYNDTGCVVYNNSTICNYDKRARGVVKVQEILSQSLNVGASWVYKRMGKKRFKSFFEKLGLTDISGIDLPNEAVPLVHNLDSPRDIEYATASFGQGVAFTPIAMVRALGALGTGYIAVPHVVKAIKRDFGVTVNIAPTEKKRVFSDKTVESISRMLTEVVDSKLDNGKRKKEHYTVAAKTGTAEVSSRHGGYIKDVYNHTFFGYFPAFNPRFVVLFVNERPQGAKYASQTLTDPFYEMVDFLINYYNIEPDR